MKAEKQVLEILVSGNGIEKVDNLDLWQTYLKKMQIALLNVTHEMGKRDAQSQFANLQSEFTQKVMAMNESFSKRMYEIAPQNFKPEPARST